jgi:hypothetical protein
MSTSTVTEARQKDKQTWLCLLLGTLVWFLHLNLVYPLTSLACRWGWFPFSVGSLSGLQVVQVGITVIAAALIVGMMFVAGRNWRVFQTTRDVSLGGTEADRHPLMPFVTMLLNGVYLLFVLTSLVPVLALPACG